MTEGRNEGSASEKKITISDIDFSKIKNDTITIETTTINLTAGQAMNCYIEKNDKRSVREAIKKDSTKRYLSHP